MNERKKTALLISFDNWGYNQYMANALREKAFEVKHINFHSFQYKYPSFIHKAVNFITKNVGILNLKHAHYHQLILEEIKDMENIEVAVFVKADFLSGKTIKAVTHNAKKSVLFVNDSIERYPRTKSILPLFDKVFSFEKKDCLKYNLTFKTNFIYKTVQKIRSDYNYKVFNISSYDKRFSAISKIAETLYNLGCNNRIIVVAPEQENKPYIEFSDCTYSIQEIESIMDDAEIILDVNRNKQEGLSFRIFESLGAKKKLITTNPDIVTYDFYKYGNIFVVEDLDHINIPSDFLEKPYNEIPEDVLNKYLVENWVDDLVC